MNQTTTPTPLAFDRTGRVISPGSELVAMVKAPGNVCRMTARVVEVTPTHVCFKRLDPCKDESLGVVRVRRETLRHPTCGWRVADPPPRAKEPRTR